MPKYTMETQLKKEIEKKLKEIKKDYDTEGMKANDLEMLRSLAFAQVQLDQLEKEIYSAQIEASESGDFYKLQKLQNIAASVRSDIISFQDKLGITRKTRQQGNESSVAAFIKDLKKRASNLYDREMIYLYCPVTNKLLGTMWIANKKGSHKVSLWCEDCQKSHFYNPAKLAKKKKRNSVENVPEGL